MTTQYWNSKTHYEFWVEKHILERKLVYFIYPFLFIVAD